MSDAIRELVRDGDTLAIEGFTHLVSFAAGHEVIRQRKRDLTLCRLTPDLVYDQMVGAGVAAKLVFSWLGNPGVGSLHAIRRRVERADPEPLELEEYAHFGMLGRYAADLPFYPLRSCFDSDLRASTQHPPGRLAVRRRGRLRGAAASPRRRRGARAAGRRGRQHPGVGADRLPEGGRVRGRAGDRGGRGAGRRGGGARADPNRTLLPGLVVDAVVVCPRGAHPSYAQGYCDRDNRFYLEWDRIARDPERLEAWLDEWVRGTAGHEEYVAKLGEERWRRLTPGPAPSGSVDYGDYGPS